MFLNKDHEEALPHPVILQMLSGKVLLCVGGTQLCLCGIAVGGLFSLWVCMAFFRLLSEAFICVFIWDMNDCFSQGGPFERLDVCML